MPSPMIKLPPPPALLFTKPRKLQTRRKPRVPPAIHMHRRDIDSITPRDLREIQAKNIGVRDLLPRRIKRDFPLQCDAGPAVPAGGEDSGIISLRVQLLPGRLVPLARFITDRNAEVFEDGEGHPAADEDGGFEGGREAVDGVREEEGGREAAALGEGHDAIVGAVAVEELEEPGVGGCDGGGGGAADKGVVGAWVEEVDACGGWGGVGAVDEVEGGWGGDVEFCAEGGWGRLVGEDCVCVCVCLKGRTCREGLGLGLRRARD